MYNFIIILLYFIINIIYIIFNFFFLYSTIESQVKTLGLSFDHVFLLESLEKAISNFDHVETLGKVLPSCSVQLWLVKSWTGRGKTIIFCSVLVAFRCWVLVCYHFWFTCHSVKTNKSMIKK